MSKRNRSRNNGGNPVVKPSVTETPETQEETPVSNVHEVIEDDLTQKNNDTPAQAQDETSQQESQDETTADESVEDEQVEEPVVEEETLGAQLEVEEPLTEENKKVAELNEKLALLKEALEGFGDKPDDFRAAAKKASDVVKFVTKFPTTPVLDALLAFFVDNKDGVTKGTNIMKGSTTLPANEEKAVGVLFNLFYELANRRIGSINPGFINSVLKKPEIVNYYNRRKAGIKQNRT